MLCDVSTLEFGCEDICVGNEDTYCRFKGGGPHSAFHCALGSFGGKFGDGNDNSAFGRDPWLGVVA